MTEKQEALYRSKMITIDQALDLIQTGDTITLGFYGSEPRNLLRELHHIRERGTHDVSIWCTNPAEEYEFLMDESLAGIIDILTVFYGPVLRKIHHTGRVHYTPHHIHKAADCLCEAKRPNVFLASVSEPDEFGYVYMSGSQQTEYEMFDVCDLHIFEVNKYLPQVPGSCRIPIDKVEYFIEANAPLSAPPVITVSPELEMIAKHIASLVNDGDTIQLGFGGLPHAVAENLMDKHDLGVHTEMFSNSLAHLMQAGVVTNDKKSINRGKSICAFCWGDKEFNQYIHRNPGIQMLPLSYVNDPNTIARNDNMVSINSALEIDLTGQVCSESLGHVQFSGIGGATDYAYGAFHSKGGKGIVALTSTAKGGTVSRITPTLTPGAVVSIQRPLVDYVITEYGIAHLRHLPLNRRVDALIQIAHPKFRDQLRYEANRLMIW